ncbi:hypothetical protein M0R45_000019 [Rubus argutus]|uniref:Uncharacterized protein n=1 Tax=Rubus argutus TaxID=59490 RepID=A0AAW1VNS7_RUBAR
MDEDDLTLSEALRIRKKHKTVETRKGSESEKLSVQDQILASLIADESSVNTTKSERLEKEVALSKVLTWGEAPLYLRNGNTPAAAVYLRKWNVLAAALHLRNGFQSLNLGLTDLKRWLRC